MELKRKNEEVFAKPLSTKVAKVSRSYGSKRGPNLIVEPVVTPSLTENEKMGGNSDGDPASSSFRSEVSETNSYNNDDLKKLVDPATSELIGNIDEQIEKLNCSKSRKIQNPEKVNLYTEHMGPEWHKVYNNLVTKPIISSSLPKIFKDFPVFGKPKNNADSKNFQLKCQRDFINLSVYDFDAMFNYCG